MPHPARPRLGHAMIFDECTPYPADEKQAGESMRLSLRWAERSRRRARGNANASVRIGPGGDARGFAQRVSRRPRGNRLDGYAHRRAFGGRAKRDMRRHPGSRGTPAGRRTPPRYLMAWARGGYRRGGGGGDRHVRLRVADAQRARTDGCSPASGTSRSATPATATTCARSTRPAGATPARTSPGPTFSHLQRSTRSSVRGSTRCTTCHY